MVPFLGSTQLLNMQVGHSTAVLNIARNAYGTKEQLQINDLSFHVKKQENKKNNFDSKQTEGKK